MKIRHLGGPVTAKFIFALLLPFAISMPANAAPSQIIVQKILSQGVPANALTLLLNFMDTNRGHSFSQSTYYCQGKDPANVAPCDEPKRIPSNRYVTFENPAQAVIVDYGSPSTDYRFFHINLLSGDVQRLYASHGLGSGKSNFATRFSDIKDSKQTSLGIFMTGETYLGKYGRTQRLYGLQNSNSQAYNRDIVLHGAWYVDEKFINSIDPLTGLKYGRLGLSWGCPALSLNAIEKMISMLGYGSLVMHYHESLMDQAQSGQEVTADP